MKKITERIGLVISELLPSFKFQKREGRLYRLTDKGWQAITLEVLPTGSQGIGKLAAHAKVRHEQIESIYTPHHPFLKAMDTKSHATLTANCDGLVHNKALADGFSLEPGAVDSFAESYAGAIKLDVIPWLDQFAEEQGLFAGLSDADPKKWVTSDRLTRFPVLLAILSIRGDTEHFDTVAAEFQEWCKLKHALVYAPLAAAMLNMRPPIRDGDQSRTSAFLHEPISSPAHPARPG
jgi:hypothetical protein